MARTAAIVAVTGLLGWVPGARAATPATWTGAGPIGSGWTTAANWQAGEPSNGAAVDFPALPGCNASADACYTSQDTETGLSTTSGLTIADDVPYEISSNGATLQLAPPAGADGLTASPSGTESGASAAEAYFAIPIMVGANQHWSVLGNGHGAGALAVGSTLSGDQLGVTLGSLARLELEGTVDLGGLSVTGATAGAVAVNGQLVLSGTINAVSTDGSIQVSDVGLQLGGYAGGTHTGTLDIADSAVTLGGAGPSGPGVTQVAGGVSIDSASTTTVELDGTNPTAGADYAQLSATGNVTLGGRLAINDEGAATSACPPPGSNTVDTFIQTTGGTLSGQFANAPDGAILELSVPCGGATRSYPVVIHYSPTAVTGTFIPWVGTTTALTPATARVTVDRTVTYTATVSPSAAGGRAPTGSVAFLVDGKTPAYCTHAGDGVLSGGNPDTATCTALVGAVGTFTITAAYGGDGRFAASTSPRAHLTVNPAPSTARRHSRHRSGRLRIVAVRAVHAGVRIRLRCPRTGARCRATLRLLSPRHARRARGRSKHRLILVGATHVTLAAGAHRTKTLRLNARGRRRLAHAHSLRVTLRAQRRVGRHMRTFATRTVVLRRSSRRH